MKTLKTLAGGAVAGAALAYLFDPDRGRGRRALLREKFVAAGHSLADPADVTARDVRNRARRQLARMRSALVRTPPRDEAIAERVRAEIGFAVGHPGAIEVGVRDGRVTLSGPVLADEVQDLLACVHAVRGVTAVEDRLTVYRDPGNVPALQGTPARRRRRWRMPFLQTVWSPTARLTAGAAGSALALLGLRAGGATGTLVGIGGLGMLLRAATNLDLARLTGIGRGRHAITLHKTIDIAAPVERVFEQWSRYEDFPQIMSFVREVRRGADDRSHWVVAGPAGVPLEWDTEQADFVPNTSIAWRTVPGALVRHEGRVRFEPTLDGGTRLEVRLSYNPPGGAVAHAVAALFGGDPRRAIDEDLVRFKSLMEEGGTTAHSDTNTRDSAAR